MRIIIAILLLSFSITFSQDGDLCLGLSPESNRKTLNFDQPVANPYEARIGFIGQPNDERLRMDIGGSFDLTQSNYGLKTLSFGVDLMTYTRLRSEGRFKFPVETTDYYFGINSAYRLTRAQKSFIGHLFDGDEQIRLRLAHISSHLIDGYTINDEFITPPFVYSREFIDVLYRPGNISNFAPYLGTNFIFSTIPRSINRLEFQTGFDFITGILDTDYDRSNFYFVAGYHFALRGFDNTFYGVNSGQAGIKYNFTNNRAIFIGVYLYDGLSMHGMFFNQKDSYIGIGTQIYYF